MRLVVIVRFSVATKQPRRTHDDLLRVCLIPVSRRRLSGVDASLSTSLRDILAAALQELIEAELTAVIGAGHGERTPERVTQRNGHRPKLLSTPAGDVEIGIPKLRTGSFFPELLEPRRRIDLNRHGFGGGVDPTGRWSHASTEEVSGRVAGAGCPACA